MAEVPVHNDALPSLTRQLGWFLEEAEALFGPRDRSFTLLGSNLPTALIDLSTQTPITIRSSFSYQTSLVIVATRRFFSSRMKLFMSYHRLMWVQLLLLRKDLQPTSV
jgi:hypothetical protein